MSPVLLLLKGEPGCGKSTLGSALSRNLRWPLIDKDDARDALQQHAEAHPHLDCNALSYAIMFNYVATQLGCNNHVIVDCPFSRDELAVRFNTLAEDYKADIVVVECYAADETEWRRRLERRGMTERSADRRHKPSAWDDILKLRERCLGLQFLEIIRMKMLKRVDTTSMCVDDQVHSVIQALDEGGLLNPG